MKKAVPYIISFFLLVYLIIVLTFASTRLHEVKCRGIQVVVDDMEENVFIEEEDVTQVIRRYYKNFEKMTVTSIDKDSLEHILCRNTTIKSAQVYYSLDGYIHVGIVQRKPVLRVYGEKGYYVDEEGKIMPLSRKYTSRVVVATGNITPDFARERLYPFVMFLRDDDFWNAYVEQIMVGRGEEVYLIPKVGNFRILLGKLENVDKKMEKLRIFLDKGINLKGWNTYKEINLKFENQIVCVKR